MSEKQPGDADDVRGLAALVRPRFVEGKLLDAATLQQEQRYLDDRQRLLTRLGLGSGVLCGLRLKPAARGGGLTLCPGVAVDPLGRLIVVPQAVEVDVSRLTDAEGRPAGEAKAGDRTVALLFQTREVEDGAAVEETFAVLVLPGAPGGGASYLWPDSMGRPTPPPGGMGGGNGSVAQVLRALERDCDSGECAPPYVVLGRVAAGKGKGGALEVHDDGRRLVVDSERLLKLSLMILERLDACCPPGPTPTPAFTRHFPNGGEGGGGATKAAGPAGAKARPAGRGKSDAGGSAGGGGKAKASAGPLRVLGVEFLDPGGQPVGSLGPALHPFRHDAGEAGAGVAAIQVTFGRPLAAWTCTAADPDTASLLVRADWSRAPHGHVPGLVSVQGPVARFQVDGGLTTFPPGDYEVTLFGDHDPAAARPAIAAADGGRLDGEPRSLPSGDGAEGGNFVFRMRIAGA